MANKSTVSNIRKKRVREQYSKENITTVYIDGVWDLFHYDHASLLKRWKGLVKNSRLVVGIIDDLVLKEQKQKSVMNLEERVEGVRHWKWVDDVIFPCPSPPTLSFLDSRQLDYYCNIRNIQNDQNHLEIQQATRLLSIQHYPTFTSSNLIMRIVKKYDSFVWRNLAKGYSRSDLNVSLFRKTGIDMKRKWRRLLKRLPNNLSELLEMFRNPFPSQCSSKEARPSKPTTRSKSNSASSPPLSDKIDRVRSTIQEAVERWSENSGEMISRFLKEFDRQSERVEGLVSNAFKFKSL